MKGALPETGRAKSKGADAKPEAGRDAHFTGTKIILCNNHFQTTTIYCNHDCNNLINYVLIL